jgi:serine protease
MANVRSDVMADLPEGAEIIRENETLGYLEVEMPEQTGVQTQEATMSAMENRDGVEYTEQSQQWEIQATPSDSLYDEQYAPQQVNAPEAWDTTFGSENVTIAVIDQGVLYDHPDLTGQFGSDKGRDFVDSDEDPQPDSLTDEYHGTHVAGIASAGTDNGDGVAGISDSQILSGRALSERGSGSTADIADAVQWAAEEGADIINLSLGGGGYSETMKNAVSFAVNNGALPIAASGNDSSNTVGYPAAYNECVAVSAVDENEQIANFSNTGDAIDVAAPGVDILSTWTNDSDRQSSGIPGRYARISGTSMACPAAAGVAALGLAVDQSLSPTELRQRLKSTAADIGLSEQNQGAGRVDAAAIVNAGGGGGGGGETEPPTVDIVGDSSRSVRVNTELSFEVDASDPDGGSIRSYEWSFGDGTTATGSSVTHTYDAVGGYTASVTVTDDDDEVTTASVDIEVTEEDTGGGGGGDQTERTTEEGSLMAYYDSESYSYSPAFDQTSQITVSLSGPADADFDLYVTYDGRTPTTDDFDARSWTQNSQEQIIVDTTDTGFGSALGILVDSYDGSGSYTVEIEEIGSGGGGGGNEGPTAVADASATAVTPGESVSFDASGSSDPDGSIVSYEWSFGDGGAADGQSVAYSYDSAGSYTATLTVTDGDGATDRDSVDLTVESTGGECGDEQTSASASGSLSYFSGEQSYSYPASLDSPCEITITLSGPADADFDLYATTDGRTPTTDDFDARSWTANSQEEIVIDATEAGITTGDEVGILVNSYSGSGDFTVEVVELGS